MKSQIILAGSGGCMRELAWQMPDWQISGYVDVTPPEHPIKVGDRIIPYLGKDDILLQQTKDINVAIAVGDPALRQKIAQKLQTNPHIHFPNLILHGAEVCSDVKLGQGCIISMDARVSTNVRMGDFVFLNIGAMVCHDGRLGDYVTLAPDVKLAGAVHIGSHCDIGLGTKVIQGITIADHVRTGAGAVVVRDVEETGTVVGVPARKIKQH